MGWSITLARPTDRTTARGIVAAVTGNNEATTCSGRTTRRWLVSGLQRIGSGVHCARLLVESWDYHGAIGDRCGSGTGLCHRRSGGDCRSEGEKFWQSSVRLVFLKLRSTRAQFAVCQCALSRSESDGESFRIAGSTLRGAGGSLRSFRRRKN